jgi:hypothetical protein
MSSLFTISQDFKSLYDMANDAENEDMEALAELFSEVETSLSDKLDNSNYIIKELDSDADALKAEAKRLTDKARALENKGKYLKELMLGAVKASGVEKLKSDKFSYYIKRTEVLNVVSEDNIGREFFRIKKEIDKTVLKKAIKDGLVVDGVSIVENESLVSR